MTMGTNCGDAKCRRWPPGPSVAAVHGLGEPSMAAALGPGGPIVGDPFPHPNVKGKIGLTTRDYKFVGT